MLMRGILLLLLRFRRNNYSYRSEPEVVMRSILKITPQRRLLGGLNWGRLFVFCGFNIKAQNYS